MLLKCFTFTCKSEGNLFEENYDLAIMGGGPAGTACALSLKESGLRIAVIDKQEFPKDKVCGDAIPGEAIETLKNIIPDFDIEFGKITQKLRIRGSVFHYNNRVFRQRWDNEAYTCRRLYFDEFLLSQVASQPLTRIYRGDSIGDLSRTPDGFDLRTTDGGLKISCHMIVGCDGINGLTSRILGGNTISRKHHISAIRAYFKGVSGVREDQTEFYAGAKYGSGYFWIFPIYEGLVNAGFGMLSDEISSANINLKEAFIGILRGEGPVHKKFRLAEQCGPLESRGIPLGSYNPVRSGERFVLAGDAASLADPLSGAGIGNAIVSGNAAAMQVLRCFRSGDFSSQTMKAYEFDLRKRLGMELMKNTIIRKTFSKFPLITHLAFLFGEKFSDKI